MSPVLKKKPAPSLDNQMRGWYKRHYITGDGEAPYWRITSFSRLVRAVDEFADEVQALRVAMHNPLAPGAAEKIAAVCELVGHQADTMLGDEVCDIEIYGEAIDWHVRGEPADEVEAERARIAAERAEREAEAIQRQTPAAVTRATLGWAGYMQEQLIKAALNGGNGFGKRAMTHEERLLMVKGIVYALFGPVQAEQFDAIATEWPTQPAPVAANEAKAKRKGGR